MDTRFNARCLSGVTKDRDVRQAVMKKVLSEHVNDPSTLVVEELGLEHGLCRVDIAVVNGHLHGYELKSDADNLNRLPAQVEAYSRALDKATIVIGPAHLTAVKKIIPSWWGIKIAAVGRRGAINIYTERPVGTNPTISSFHLAHLLWRPEIITILKANGLEKGLSKLSRSMLYQLAAEELPLSVLRLNVRETLKNRTDWRRPR